MEKQVNITEEISTFIYQLLKNELPEGIVYHNYLHTQEVVENCEKIMKNHDLEDSEKDLLLIAAWFHDTGFIKTYDKHEEASVEIAEKFLEKEGFLQSKIDEIKALILSTRSDQQPKNLLEEILHDADILHVGKKSFFSKGELIRIEWERYLDKNYTGNEWFDQQEEFLVKNKFYTTYATKKYGKRREKNIRKLRKMAQSHFLKNKKINVKKKRLGRGIETMYRATYRNHINLSSIADSKANMMISINAIIMSVIITIVGSGFTFAGQEFYQHLRFTVPMTILLVSALVSVIFAVLSARPNVTKKKVNEQKIKNKKSSILFFGNFSKIALPKFIENLAMFRRDQELLYDNMSIDMYYLGLVLTKKYKLLRYSYNIFMFGLILCVAAFLVIFFYSYQKV